MESAIVKKKKQLVKKLLKNIVIFLVIVGWWGHVPYISVLLPLPINIKANYPITLIDINACKQNDIQSCQFKIFHLKKTQF